MVFHRDIIDNFVIKLSDSFLTKLEDSQKNNQDFLISIEATHYGYLNGNRTIYKHDSAPIAINSFVSPNPIPIIRDHKKQTSSVFGNVVAADYVATQDYESLNDYLVDGLNNEEYIQFCKDVIVPMQNTNSDFKGLGYAKLIGKLTDSLAIDNVLKNEFLSVSIGATPKTLTCSECGNNLLKGPCIHMISKKPGTFKLADGLKYNELSFVNIPADKYAKIVEIHDEEMDKNGEFLSSIESSLDLISTDSFYSELTNNKTIHCIDNLCAVMNKEDIVTKQGKAEDKVTNIQLHEEFSEDQLKSVQLSSGKELDVTLLDAQEDTKFALKQKNADGSYKNRFPLSSPEAVETAYLLLDSAIDLTDQEKTKVRTSLIKKGKEFGLALEDSQTTSKTATQIKEDLQSIINMLNEVKPFISTDAKISKFSGESVDSISNTIKWAITDMQFVLNALKDDGDTDIKDSLDLSEMAKNLSERAKDFNSIVLTDEQHAKLESTISELTEEVESLNKDVADLNFTLRDSLAEDIIAKKVQLGVIKEEEGNSYKTKLSSLPYSVLKDQLNEASLMVDKFIKENPTQVLEDSKKNPLEITKVVSPVNTNGVQLTDGLDNDNTPVVEEPVTSAPTAKKEKIISLKNALDKI